MVALFSCLTPALSQGRGGAAASESNIFCLHRNRTRKTISRQPILNS